VAKPEDGYELTAAGRRLARAVAAGVLWVTTSPVRVGEGLTDGREAVASD